MMAVTLERAIELTEQSRQGVNVSQEDLPW